MQRRSLVDRYYLNDPPTAAMYAYTVFSVLCGIAAPRFPVLESLTEAWRPTTVLALVAAHPSLASLKTILPLLLVGAVAVAIATAYGFHRQIPKNYSPPSSGVAKMYALGVSLVGIAVICFAFPLYAISVGGSESLRSRGIESIMSSGVLSATILYAAFFWGAQFFIVLGAFVFRRSARAA